MNHTATVDANHHLFIKFQEVGVNKSGNPKYSPELHVVCVDKNRGGVTEMKVGTKV